MNLRLISAAAACLLLPSLALAADDSQFTLGGGVAAGARYSGSKQNTVAPVVVLDYSHASGFFASTLRGIGYGGEAAPLTYSAALGYRGERKEKNEKGIFGNTGSADLKGMGDIKGSATANLRLGYKPLSMLEFNVGAEIPLSQRENGKTYRAGVTAQLLDAPNDHVSLGATAGFADNKYAQTYYGVTAKQAAASQFKAYQAKSGLYEANLMLTWQHKIDQKWSVTSMLGANHLLRDASRSPLTQRKTSPTGAVYVSYAY
ncbi:MipA/OmpV family protein [Duganella sp. BJB1802]|uniref:MipA/OmpV family protein n=1 Tax=Duganella sp. BJB1802 TaxID=2744575 RepID=UPI001592DDDD|nr:MipA/OmpV family protein [Duganella sp. BJB1802]NVD72928.1 MipA/OmpV family protein [Duganella sp. BJB1802]